MNVEMWKYANVEMEAVGTRRRKRQTAATDLSY